MRDRLRIRITALVTLYMWALLLWEHLHGGVASHHFLHRADLPAISNWWGGLLLPVITWILVGHIHRRSAVPHDAKAGASRYPGSVVAGFAGALLYGIAFSTFFALDYSAATSHMFQALFLLALFLPIYRAESLLGFVLGMTFTFGAILPTIVGSVVAVVAMVIYLYVRPGVIRLFSRAARSRASA